MAANDVTDDEITAALTATDDLDDGNGGTASDLGETVFINEGEGDEAIAFLVDESTGEVEVVNGCPSIDIGVASILQWYGPKRVATNARIAGLVAERQVHLDKIADRYDRRIKYQENLIKYLDGFYTPCFRAEATRLLASINADKAKPVKTVRTGLFKFSFSAQREKWSCLDPLKAIEWLKSKIDPKGELGTWRFEPKVLLSKVPPIVKDGFKADLLSAAALIEERQMRISKVSDIGQLNCDKYVAQIDKKLAALTLPSALGIEYIAPGDDNFKID